MHSSTKSASSYVPGIGHISTGTGKTSGRRQKSASLSTHLFQSHRRRSYRSTAADDDSTSSLPSILEEEGETYPQQREEQQEEQRHTNDHIDSIPGIGSVRRSSAPRDSGRYLSSSSFVAAHSGSVMQKNHRLQRRSFMESVAEESMVFNIGRYY